MDIVLIILIVVLILIIVTIYVLNTVKTTGDLNVIFEKLLLQKADTVSYCIGKNEVTGKYKNVVTNSEGKTVIVENDYPVGLDGKYIILKDHGTITARPDNNGFKMSGADLIDFKCPDGFEGINCALKAICSPEDAGKLKPLTYTQFNELGLYLNTFERNPIQTFRSIMSEPTHPRIRINCLNKEGDYELQTCPNNRLLDENLQCKPYDICSDRINGYKHNYKIRDTDPDLQKNEYYICDNNVSVKTKCSDDTVFSMASGGCINESPCFNKGNATLPIDDKSYIQCSNDKGKIIKCKDGVDDNGGVLSCHVSTCQPETFTVNVGVLSYKYGDTVCINDKPDTKRCNNSPNPRTYNWKWAEDFTYTIDDWPTEIMDENRNCVPPTDDIITNPIIDLQFTDLMPEAHPFNLKTQKYVCPEGTKYIIDYVNQKILPEDPFYYNAAVPCFNEPLNFKYPVIPFSSPHIYYMLLLDFLIPKDLNESSNYWPIVRYHPGYKSEYIATEIIQEPNFLYLQDYISDYPPIGFSDPEVKDPKPNQEERLKLIGADNAPYAKNRGYFFLATGEFLPPVFRDAVKGNYVSIPIYTTVYTDKKLRFSIDMFSITKKIQILPTLYFDETGITYTGSIEIKHKRTYIVIDINIDEQNPEMRYLKIHTFPEIKFDPKQYPVFKFE